MQARDDALIMAVGATFIGTFPACGQRHALICAVELPGGGQPGNSTATNITGSFSVENVTGGSGNDTLTGDAVTTSSPAVRG
jgi:hypothetical protein